MIEGAKLGLKPYEILDLTLRDFFLFARGRYMAELEVYKRAVFEAWHSAAFNRSKKIPDLQQLLNRYRVKKSIVPLTPKQLLKKAEIIVKMFNGVDNKGMSNG